MKTKRDAYFDTIRLFAIFVVFTSHFVNFFYVGFGTDASFFPVRYIFTVLTGKFGLMMLAVLMGFFAYRSGMKKRKSLLRYILERYSYFVICGLLANTVYGIYYGKTVLEILSEAFTVGSNIFLTYWCMRDFLLASVLCYAAAYYAIPLGAVAGLGVVLWLDKLWLAAICMLGVLLAKAMEHKDKINGRMIILLTAVIAFGAVYLYVKPAETFGLFLVQGIFSAALILFASLNDRIRKIIANPVTGALGRNSLVIFLLHLYVYSTLGAEVFVRFRDYGTTSAIAVSWLVCSVLLCLVSFPVNYAINYVSGKWNELIGRILEKTIEKQINQEI